MEACGGESKNEQMDETFTLSRTTSNILKPCNLTIIILEMAKIYLKNIHYLKPSPEDHLLKATSQVTFKNYNFD